MITEKQVEAVAAAILDEEEFGLGGPHGNKVKRENNPNWGLHLYQAGMGVPHDGDCTKKPYTCLACTTAIYREIALAAINAYLKLKDDKSQPVRWVPQTISSDCLM